MTGGYFGSEGELYFEIELAMGDGEIIAVVARLDTGFTDWLAMNHQDADGFGWSILGKKEMHTARGSGEFLVYEATVNFIERAHTIPIIAGAEVNEVLLGLKWLENHKLVVDTRNNILTFES